MPLTIIYSFNKRGWEAEYWTRELAAASTDSVQFVPFNHDRYLDPSLYLRAQLLDNLYFERDERLFRLYADFEATIKETNAAAVIVENCFPYHPDYLRRLSIYKVLRTSDGPISAYDRDFAYLHAYDHVIYHSPAYSRDMEMEAKLRYCGAKRCDFVPLGLFDANFDPGKAEDDLVVQRRDIDVIFIGAMHVTKMPLLAHVQKALGSRLRIHGLTSFKRNAYYNIKYGFPGWVRPVPFEQYVPLYQRSRIGINVHNRGDDSVGNYRLFDLPANGVLQISDGGELLERFFRVGSEIERYRNAADLIEKVRYYLAHEEERARIVRAAYRRVTGEYRIGPVLRGAAEMIREGMGTASKDGPAGVGRVSR